MTATVVLTTYGGVTKSELHREIVNVIVTAASRSPRHQSWPIAPGAMVDALQPGEADRIVRNMAESDSAYEWRGLRMQPQGVQHLRTVFAAYRRLEWSEN
jgi:hypothetical protein